VQRRSAVLRVTFGQVSLGALVLVEVARDDRIDDAPVMKGNALRVIRSWIC
jgi:hypothetical protein